ncbi:hypothetical protein ES332_D03G194500v1 [Gossypium tomentosum]|uniref:NB-ARC domain-containing protein n=1 Tax=Gossypium tomentosum TaxID=34277 RepID=A0A5D2LPM4_GOSTO|nr:hypothetical protein ES332_D03G194500v1 [Gossypium tomentosum]
MAESFAFEIAAKVLKKLGSATYERISLAWDVREEFEKLKLTLAAIKSVVLDAEQQQARNHEISHWLHKVKDACYETEDLKDEFEIQALRRQVLEQGSILACRFRMGNKIKKANEMLNEITANKAKFPLTQKHETNVSHRERETYSFVKTSSVIGRDEAKQHIELHKVLQDCLNGKRFFMVLDDVWNEDKKKWTQWSRIIVTTRSRKVATITGTIPPYDLEHLSYDNCLSLFLKLAFKEGEEKQDDNLVRIGEGIVQKCKGVALAMKTLGSLLCSTRVQHDWELVRDSELWKLKQEENDILPALKLSYDHLPWYLKQCFAFCSVFPKDLEFNDIFLISLWKANGFLQSPYENEEPEDIGKRYIQELLSRSLFHQVEDMPFHSSFKMHDLVHDLAFSVVQNEVNSCNHYSTGNVQYLLFDLSKQDASQLPNNLRRLQSLLLLDGEGKADSESLIAKVISRSKHLRVLHLSGCSFKHLPNNIRYLKQLRYLNLACNGNTKRLPNSICNLQKNLLEGIRNLTAIRELYIDECNNLISLPQGLKYLTTLQTLAISDCEKLDLTNGELDLERKEDGSLRKLAIGGVPKLESLPQWILLGSTKTLQHLFISNLENVLTLPAWFQHITSLQILYIRNCLKLSSPPEGMQDLAALKILRIEGCPKLNKKCIEETGEVWSKVAHVPDFYCEAMKTSTTDDE